MNISERVACPLASIGGCSPIRMHPELEIGVDDAVHVGVAYDLVSRNYHLKEVTMMKTISSAVVIVLWFVAPLYAEPEMTAHFINVGQGDSTLVEFPCGAILIDAGAQDDRHVDALIDYLSKFFERRSDLDRTLDLIIITHNHLDHNLALRAVVENFKVKRYIDNGITSGSGHWNAQWIRGGSHPNVQLREISDEEITSLDDYEGLEDGFIDPLNCGEDGDPRIRILSGRLTENPGWDDSEFANQNNQSLVVRIDFGESSFLFTGDLEEPAIETLVEWYEGTSTLDVDVYQVGHHGSANGTTVNLLDAMTPKAAVISCGKWTFGRRSGSPFTTYRYGHPRLNIIEMLSEEIKVARSPKKTVKAAVGPRRFKNHQVDKAVYATAWDGTVQIKGTLDADPVVVPASDDEPSGGSAVAAAPSHGM